MKVLNVILLTLFVSSASARVGPPHRELKADEDFIEIAFKPPTKKIVTPGRGNGLALGGRNDNIRVMVGFKNNRGKLDAMATQASEMVNAFKSVNALTMIIPRARLNGLANNPNIE
jgi:hypothetical protein